MSSGKWLGYSVVMSTLEIRSTRNPIKFWRASQWRTTTTLILDECELDDLSHDGAGDAGSLDGSTDPLDGRTNTSDGSTDPSDASLVGTESYVWELEHSIHDIKSAMTATAGLWEEEEDDDRVDMRVAKKSLTLGSEPFC